MKNFRPYLIYLPIAVLVFLGVIVFARGLPEKGGGDFVSFLNQYGWQVSPAPIEEVEVTIPNVFDDVYKNYNELQKENGMDLEPYRGKTVTRVTYRVLNYPNSEGREIRANLLVYDGQVIAGDIMSPAIDGFMHGLTVSGAAVTPWQTPRE